MFDATVLNIFSGFLSLSGGAIFAQAVYFLFVKYPAELSRLDAETGESWSRFEWEMAEELRALNLLKDFAEHHVSLFAEWGELEKNDIRQKHVAVLAQDMWRAKTIDGAGNSATSRAAEISGEALAGMLALLCEARPMTDRDLSVAKAQSHSALDSFGTALRLARVLNDSRKAKNRQFRNETQNLNFLRACASLCVLGYGLAAAEIAEFTLLHLPTPRPTLAMAALYGIFSITLLLLVGSFIRERKVHVAKSGSQDNLDA